jgi:hypothetical protein
LIWISHKNGWDFTWWKRSIANAISWLFKRLFLSDFDNEIFRRLKYFFLSVAILSFISLAITGFIPVAIFNSHISGIFLIIHVTIAPVFVAALAASCLFFVHSNQFDVEDWQLIKARTSQKSADNTDYHIQLYLLKVYFWLFLTFSVLASLSMIVSMFPFFGTDGQTMMLTIHQYTTLGLLIIAFLYADFKLIVSDKSVKQV